MGHSTWAISFSLAQLEFIHLLERKGIDYLFLTNNSSRSRREYVLKLRRLGLELPEDKIFTSGEATALFLKARAPGARIYLVGTPALEQEFRDHGFVVDRRPPRLRGIGI